MEFRKEAQGRNWSFTNRMMNNGGNNSGTVTEMNIPRSVMFSAIVDPQEVRQMMDGFEALMAAREKGDPHYADPNVLQHPLHLAGLWVPTNEFSRYPTDNLSIQIEKNTAVLGKYYQETRSMKNNYALTDAIIRSDGRPTIPPNKLNWVIEQYKQKLQNMQNLQLQGLKQINSTIDNCLKRIQILEGEVLPMIVKIDRISRSFSARTYKKKDYTRLGYDVWMNNPQLRWIFEQRAKRKDPRVGNLNKYLKILQGPVSDDPIDWDTMYGPGSQWQKQQKQEKQGTNNP